MLHLDTLGDDPDIDTLVANDPEFHQPDRGRQRESRAGSLIDGFSGRTRRARE